MLCLEDRGRKRKIQSTKFFEFKKSIEKDSDSMFSKMSKNIVFDIPVENDKSDSTVHYMESEQNHYS